MKKILVSIAIIGTLGAFAVQHANAGRGWYGNSGPGCPYWNSGYSQIQDTAAQKNIDGFLQATVELRKNLAMKQSEYQAVMNSESPDPAKAAAITGEIFQLRNQIRAKAMAAGLNPGFGPGGNSYRGGWGGGYGPGYGYGPGGGRGPCRGFMY
jgi:zinc resistance-associated protein